MYLCVIFSTLVLKVDLQAIMHMSRIIGNKVKQKMLANFPYFCQVFIQLPNIHGMVKELEELSYTWNG